MPLPHLTRKAMSKLIPANIITGFLGVGKTTAITHLLRHKPEGEVWSVLVNEFGEIGIDGAMLKSINAHVREVPGAAFGGWPGRRRKIRSIMWLRPTRPNRFRLKPRGP